MFREDLQIRLNAIKDKLVPNIPFLPGSYSSEKLEKIFDNLDGVNIFIHDSLHTYKNMMFEFELAETNLSDSGIILSDDVLDNDAFFDFSNNQELKNYLIKVGGNLGLGVIIKN